MNPRTRKLLALKQKHGLTWLDIASVLDRSHATVRQYGNGYRVIPVKLLNLLTWHLGRKP